jgi:hypothetical protein
MAQMTDGTGRRSLAQTVGLLFGATYVLVGLIGFAVTSGVGFADEDGNRLLGIFEVNPLHNVVHLLIGAALLWGAMKGVEAARAINTTVGATYLLVGIVGFFIGGTEADILALNGADHLLHLASAAVLLTAGLVGPRTTATADTTTTTRSTTGTRY